jgi:adenosylcobinamide-GDP ribazoletransferase
MTGLLTAVGFLSAVPVGARGMPRDGQFGRAVVWFPAVGLFIGLALAGVDWCARALWDSYVAAALIIGTTVVLTGGLHLDGLMDTADAYFSRRDRSGMLEVMRDSRVGALGVAAGVSVLLMKFATYGHLAGVEHWRAIAIAPMMGRLAVAVGVTFFAYARSEGTGARLAAETRAPHALAACIMALAIAAGLLGLMGVILALVALLLSLAVGWHAGRKLGGLTGDVYGALNEMVELVTLLGLATFVRAWSTG